jgi:uncharacterized membrane protein YeaQ/YmgE (transglycosylase-associated protein family)
MSWVFIGLIGALTGWLMGQFVTGSRQSIAVDLIAGAIGAWVTVVLSRLVVPVTASGPLMSAIVAVIGAIVMLFVMNRFLRDKLMPASRPSRR